jgi:hypothetical protein
MLGRAPLSRALSVLGFPDTPPNDPDYAPCEQPGATCSIYDEQWNYFSFEPRSTRGAGVSGVSADLAWKITPGRRDVLIAVLDCGIKWDSGDLMRQLFLNRGELPEPQDANGQSTPGRYDLNGDGVFNIEDYAFDPRVHDANANGRRDPGDLIGIFSDGVDQDANGYADDISGWDFFEADNDPYDQTRFGHGTTGARDAAAEGDNAQGGIGMAPRASLMAVRVGDSFVVDGNEFAMGLVYATDMGAAVIDDSLGALNNSSLARQAVDYAYRRGVVIQASSADELSFHHNWPANYDHTIVMMAIVPDSAGVLQDQLPTTSFLAHNNCSNYGGRIHLSMPGVACSSEATAQSSGVSALIVSRGRDLADAGQLAWPLTAEEVKQLATLTAEDIHLPAAPNRYPSQAGWDQYFGYGRIHAKHAVGRVGPQSIPPEVDLQTPEWFATLDPAASSTVAVTGRIAADRASGYSYELQYGLGVEPKSFTTVLRSTGHTSAVEGVLGSLDLAAIPVDFNRPPRKPNDFTITLRAQATDSFGNLGEDRMTLFLHHDPDLHWGRPLPLGVSGESSPKLADLDADGVVDLVLATADGQVLALREDASPVPGWPVQVELIPQLDAEQPGNYLGGRAYREGHIAPARSAIGATPAVGDLDADGVPEVVVATYEGLVHVWHADGRRAAGFPVSVDFSLSQDRSPTNVVDHGIFASPALADLDGDGKLEILVAAFDQRIYAWRHDGGPVAGWPALARDLTQAQPLGARILSSPAVGDITGDGRPEVVVGTNELYDLKARVYAFDRTGRLVPGWPVTPAALYPDVLPLVGQGVPSSAALADFDGDGALEVCINAVTGALQIFKGNGAVYRTLPLGTYGSLSDAGDSPTFLNLASPAVADLDGDGHPDVMAGTTGFGYVLSQAFSGQRIDFEQHISAWSVRDRRFVTGFPRVVEDWQFFENPAVADIDGDGLPEVLFGTGGYLLHAFNKWGQEPAGWPKFTGGWIIASPAVGDLDGDGLLEVAAVTREGRLYVWDTPGPAQRNGRSTVQWSSFRGNLHNTGAWP